MNHQSFFQEAARLNNDGVTALVEGDVATSINLLMNTTVRMMKQHVVASEQGASPYSKESSSSFQRFTTVEIPTAVGDEHLFLHRAIKMPTSSDEDISSPLDLYVYSAAVIFNLALAHHILGAKKINARNKAEKLYATIIKMLDERVGHMQSALLLKLYCINNMAHIRLENGELLDQIQDGLVVGEVSTLLITADECLLEGAEVQGMLMRVLLLKKPNVAAAA